MFKLLNCFTIMLAFSLSGCINLGTSIVNIPTYFSGLNVYSNVSYGQESWQRLDIYTAKAQENKLSHPKPVIIFFYGGRWSSGAKEQYRFVANRLVKAGYLVVVPDYVKYPQAKFPAFMDDAARSVAWVSQNITHYGGQPSQLYILGHSAGAHMGALLISDTHYLKAQHISPRIIKAFAGLAGPYAFKPDEPDLKDIFGPKERYPQMQVPNFIQGNEPPMLLLHGTADTLVEPSNLTRLTESIKQYQGRVTTKLYPKIGHIGIISSFIKAHSKTPVADDVVTFFRQYP